MENLKEYSPTMRGSVQATPHKTFGAAGAYTVFDKTVGGTPNLQYCRLQNIGADEILVCINDTATAEVFNAILAKDTAAGEGNGGVIEIPGSWNVSKISVYAMGATDLAILLVVTPASERIVN